MKLKTPSAPFSPVPIRGESITIETEGKILVLPSGNADILPSFNEYTLNSNRLSIAESPFGGLKGSGSPDYAPGTIFCQTDGVYLTDTSGTNSIKTLTAGKLKELSLLTVDTAAHSITEEFIVENTGESNNPMVIDVCDSATGWDKNYGTVSSISSDGSKVTVAGTTQESGYLLVAKTIAGINISSTSFLSISIQSSVAAQAYISIGKDTSNRAIWDKASFSIPAETATKYLVPFKAPASASGSNPSSITGSPNFSNGIYLRIGIKATANASISFSFYTISVDVAKPAYLELQTPDNLADSSLQLYTHNGTAYQLCRTDKLDSTYSNVSATPANCTFADSTKLDDVYGAGLGRSVFPKGDSGDVKSGSLAGSQITYSANKGTQKRIGFMVQLPPSDGGRTNFNKVRIKSILYYSGINQTSLNMGSSSYTFEDFTNVSYGLQNQKYPWIALYDPSSNLIDFYLFTHRPKNLSFKRDETGNIHEITLYPGNGMIYHGRITHANLTLDSDSNTIPDCLEASVEGSITKFLQSYGMVI